MAAILSVSGSPSATSRTARLLRHLDDRLRLQGHEVTSLEVRTLPPAPCSAPTSGTPPSSRRRRCSSGRTAW
ncbi:FMN reductase [Streptomyces sp. BpilaLS-43]|nr:FMN reductase [Streptomyces sp. BpilaLS-43]